MEKEGETRKNKQKMSFLGENSVFLLKAKKGKQEETPKKTKKKRV